MSPQQIDTDLEGQYRSRAQSIAMGSYGLIHPHPRLADVRSFTLCAYIKATLPLAGRQAILGAWVRQHRRGYGLQIDGEGKLSLVIGNGSDVFQISVEETLRASQWYFIGAAFDACSGEVALWQEPVRNHDFELITPLVQRGVSHVIPDPTAAPFTLAAWADLTLTEAHFNGCIDRPRLASAALTQEQISLMMTSPRHPRVEQHMIAAWDFSREMSTDQVIDIGEHSVHGVLVNQPTRAMPGAHWSGQQFDWRHAPEQYSAVHFHEDDLIDACWETDFAWRVPAGTRSGIYAVLLSAGPEEFWIPFVVRPKQRVAQATTVLLAPTATYIAYQNHRSRFMSVAGERLHGRLCVLDGIDVQFLGCNDMGVSTYDRHRDGSGVAYASHLRPSANTRPHGKLWNFNADLLIIAWLEHSGRSYEVVTDEDLHREGARLLAPYRVVMTGSHPEYVSQPMLDGIQGYLEGGGRLMYLGGNGFYWRIAYHPTRTGVIEVRRSKGTRAWEMTPGASHMSFTGEPGGLWRDHGRAPQRLAGVGFNSQGFDRCTSFSLTAEAADPRISWAFEGITSTQIGTDGVHPGGAAGIEIDSTSVELGTPAHALVVARSANHSNTYEPAVESVLVMHGATDALLNRDICAEIVFFETAYGGAVFSVGSIAYTGALCWNDFANDVARLTGNVLDRFNGPASFHVSLSTRAGC